jgi:hypothetical protein
MQTKSHMGVVKVVARVARFRTRSRGGEAQEGHASSPNPGSRKGQTIGHGESARPKRQTWKAAHTNRDYAPIRCEPLSALLMWEQMRERWPK